mgnify:CR=1 FL=1
MEACMLAVGKMIVQGGTLHWRSVAVVCCCWSSPWLPVDLEAFVTEANGDFAQLPFVQNSELKVIQQEVGRYRLVGLDGTYIIAVSALANITQCQLLFAYLQPWPMAACVELEKRKVTGVGSLC